MLRADKERVVRELAEKFQRAQGVYLADFTGLDVASITELRRKMRSASVEFRVVKNTLAKLAVDQAGIPELSDFLTGPTCLAFGYDDPVTPARVLDEFARGRERPKIRTGFLEGRLLVGPEVSAVANLPSREELLARIVMLIQSPLGNFASRCRGLLQKFVATVDALREQRHNEGGFQGPEDQTP